MKLQEALKQTTAELEERMNDLLPDPTKTVLGENLVAKAMRYSTLSGGKRLRPFLVVETAKLFGVSGDSSLSAASAIEFIHTYSLMHDDLPELDNDDQRRGKPSCHKKFDEATALLAGDALLTLAFEILSHPNLHPDSAVRSELVFCIARACGAKGMVGGQMTDMISEKKQLTIEQITRMQRQKTGELFAVSCEAGAILGKAPVSMRSALRGYAYDIGLAFQITDDLLDADTSAKSDNKKKRLRKSVSKETYVSSLGIKKAQLQASILVEQAIRHLSVFGKKAEILVELAEYVIKRKM